MSPTPLIGRIPASALWLAPVVLVSLLTGYWVDHAPIVGGDTPVLVTGAQAALDCIGQGIWTSCGENPPARVNEYYSSLVGPWPPLQYVPVAAMLEAGLDAHVMTGLALLSIAALLGSLWLAWAVGRRVSVPVAVGLVVLALSGPLLYYAVNTFGESLASGLGCAFVAALVLRPRVALVAGTAFAAALTKETAAPFVAAIALVIAFAPATRDPLATRARLAGAAIGCVLALAAHAALNVFRFGGPRNADLLQDAFRVPGLGRKLEYLAALVVSPNGGLLEYWPVAFALFAWLGVLAVVRRSWPALAVLALLGILLAGLASYHTPFGWYAWGPRLTIPWVLPLALVAVAVHGRELDATLRWLLRPRLAVPVLAVLVALAAAPHLGVLFDGSAATELFNPAKGECAVPGARIGDDQYYRCVSEQAWERQAVQISALGGLKSPRGALFLGVLGLAALALLELARREGPGEPPGRPARQRSAPAKKAVTRRV